MANTTTIFLVYIVYGGIITLFSINGTKLLIRDKSSRLAQIIATFFYTSAIGLTGTLIYRTLEFIGSTDIYIIGHKFAVFMNCFTLIFLLIFNLIILKGNAIINDKKKGILIAIWAVISSPIFYLPKVYLGYRNDDKSIVPQYDLPVTIYGLCLMGVWYVLIIIITIQNFKKFTDSASRKKYIMFNIALFMLCLILAGNYIQNYLHQDTFRNIFTYMGVIIFPAGLMLYRAVRKEKTESITETKNDKQ